MHALRKLWAQVAGDEEMNEYQEGFHELSFDSITGEKISLESFKGKYVLLVNVASECGFTSQYNELEELQKTFDDVLQVIGFPCNQFGKQEPGAENEILQHCKVNYGVTFPLSKKIKVNGEEAHPIYKWLTDKKLNRKIGSEVEWNFQKYLVDPDGEFLAVFQSATSPLDEKVLRYLPRKS